MTQMMSVGITCGKLHLSIEDKSRFTEAQRKHIEADKRDDKVLGTKTDNENKAKKVETEELIDKENNKEENNKKGICQDHIYNGYCTYGGDCRKIHISLREHRSTIKCRDYAYRRCYRIDCHFKHEKNTICKYFLEGRCKKDKRCNYRHGKIETKEEEVKSTYADKTKDKKVEKIIENQGKLLGEMMKDDAFLGQMEVLMSTFLDKKKNAQKEDTQT